MKNDVVFMALGGAQSIGASCYLVQVGDKRIMLDCGMGVCGKISYGPNFESLYKIEGFNSLAKTDVLCISHAHYDHVGYLENIVDKCPDTPILGTYLTKILTKYLIDEKTVYEREKQPIEKQLAHDRKIQRAVERISQVGYLTPIEIAEDLKIRFFEAGHIPGAAMIYVETGGRRILYTGDFSMSATPLADRCMLPSINPDTVVVCGVHAKQPEYTCREAISYKLRLAARELGHGVPVHLGVKQLTKGIELVQLVREVMRGVPIYLDRHIWELGNQLQRQGVSVFDKDCSHYDFTDKQKPFGIYIGAEKYGKYFDYSDNIDFSLHAEYEDIKTLLEFYGPENAVIVHTADAKLKEHEDVLKRELGNINVIYASEGQEYKF